MYIPDFWCGVAATIVVEALAFILIGILCSTKDNKQQEEDK